MGTVKERVLARVNGSQAVKLVKRLRFYAWAYGEIGEADSEIGILGEYIVGQALDCLPKTRSVNGEYDLTRADGTTIEVKTTCRARQPKARNRHKSPSWQWNISDQRRALEGRSTIADLWIFIKVEMPEDEMKKRTFDPFADQWYTLYLVTGQALLATGQKRQISESNVKRIAFATCTPKELAKALVRSV